MDEVEIRLAVKRMKTWPTDERSFVLSLPPGEARFFVEAAGLLDARPADGEERTEK